MHCSYKDFVSHGHGRYGPWFDLVNSEEWDGFGCKVDHFGNPAWLRFFLRRWGFQEPRWTPFPVQQWAALRSALRSICRARARHGKIRPKDLRALNHALNVTGTRRLRKSQNGFALEFVSAAVGWHNILEQTAWSFAELLAKGGADRIKICRNPECRWVFYDETKGKTRCWCNDKVCGNRDRVRKARAKAARQLM
jgi:predicted RNA-binding Zn ribbon-like protein